MIRAATTEKSPLAQVCCWRCLIASKSGAWIVFVIWCSFLVVSGLLACRDRLADDAVGLAGVARAVAEEAVVVAACGRDREARGGQRVHVGRGRDRAGDAGGPELGVAARLLLERRRADDVRDGQAAAGAQDAGRLREDAVLDGGEVDDAVRDDDVE